MPMMKQTQFFRILYSEIYRVMSKSELELLPIRFDPQNFADQATELKGLVAVKAMHRLQENVLSIEPMVRVKLMFSRGLFGYPHVQGEAHVEAIMKCERCLDEVEVSLNPVISVLIKPESDSIPEDQKNVEGITDIHEYDGKCLVLSELIEEELLLALPIVPKHEDISLCNQDMVAWLASNEEHEEYTAEKADNPFAILKR